MQSATAKNSMRLRLALIPSAILLLGILVAIAATLFDANRRIGAEIGAGVATGDLLVGYALDDLALASDPDAALRRLRAGLSHIRHIRVAFPPGPAKTDEEPKGPSPAPETTGAQSSPPAWFLGLFEPAKVVRTYPLSIGGAFRGALVMASEPADEIAEIWRDLVFLTALLTAISIAVVALILSTARLTLKPIDQLVEGLDRLGRGQFDAVADIRIAELSRIGDRFNRLALTLADARAENHRLIDRLLSIQDTERKELARELHDEFGAALFGIRAAASCIREAAATGVAAAEARREIIDRAATISDLADSIQKHNYRILERIRPMILDQMGLPDALRHLVASWGARNEGVSSEIRIPEEIAGRRFLFDEEVGLTAYRIVQECLTNVARHSKAKRARVALDVDFRAESPDRERSDRDSGGKPASGFPRPDPGEAERLRLSIEDDGVGPPPDFSHGFGLLGMHERLRKLGGSLKIEGGGGGTRIEASIPLRRGAPST